MFIKINFKIINFCKFNFIFFLGSLQNTYFKNYCLNKAKNNTYKLAFQFFFKLK